MRAPCRNRFWRRIRETVPQLPLSVGLPVRTIRKTVSQSLKVCYKTHSLHILEMDLSKIFERLLIKEIDDLGKYKTGRPAKLENEEALKK